MRFGLLHLPSPSPLSRTWRLLGVASPRSSQYYLTFQTYSISLELIKEMLPPLITER